MRWLIGVVLLAVQAVAVAQETAPTEVWFLLLPATGDPALSTPVLTRASAIAPTTRCGLAPEQVALVPAPIVDPAHYTFDDPFTAGRRCLVEMPPNLPAGSYQWAIALVAPACDTGAPCPGPRTIGAPPITISAPPPPPSPTCVYGAIVFAPGDTLTLQTTRQTSAAMVRTLEGAGWRIDALTRVQGNRYTVRATCVGG